MANSNLPKGKAVLTWVIATAVTGLTIFGVAWVASKGWKKGQS